MEDNIISVCNIKKYFDTSGSFLFKKQNQRLLAVDDVSFSIKEGETLGLVGESGCGKTTVGRILLKLYYPDEGRVFFEKKDIFKMSAEESKNFRKNVQIIFQDPFASLNPRMPVYEILGEPISINKIVDNKKEKKEKILELLDLVGLSHDAINKYPHEFSSGQRQRIGIARALSTSPKFIVCDEPTSSLDVSIQAQIINLLMELQEKKNLTYLFIAHNISIIQHVSNKIAVMYLGKIVELGETKEIINNPLHPYTKLLLSSVLLPYPKKEERRVFFLDISSAFSFLSGCKFASRCNYANSLCKTQEPEMKNIQGHFVLCHKAT